MAQTRREARRTSVSTRPWRRRLATGLATTAYISIILGLVTGGPMLDRYAWVPWKITAGIVLIVTLLLHVTFKFVLPIRRSHQQPEIQHLDGAKAFDLQRRAGKANDVSVHQAKAFFTAVVLPTDVRQRVVERYTPKQRTMRRQVLVEGQVPAAAVGKEAKSPQTWLMPIALPPKGRLYDNFEVDNGSDSPVSTLSYSEYLELVACVIRTMLVMAYRKPVLPSSVREAEHLALVDVMYRGRVKDLTGAAALRALYSPSSPTYTPPESPVWLDWTISLVERLANRFAIVARVAGDHEGRFIVRYTETVIPPLLVSENTGPISRLKGMARILLGARPVNLQISLHVATTCQSYHLYVHSEESLYLGVQDGSALPEYVAQPVKDGKIPPYYRFRSRLGQSYAHFYTRYFPTPSARNETPIIHFRFYEKPPGSTFRAAIASVACFLLVWLVAFVSTNALPAEDRSDAPAFLLVVPALAAAFLGFDSSGRRLLEGTLAARFSLILTAIVALGASGLYMADWGRIDIFPYYLTSNGSLELMWLDRTPWCVLVLLALLNAIYITFTYLIRAWEFTHLSARPKTLDGSID